MTAPTDKSPLKTTTVPAELRCQYPSKRCDNARTNKRGGGLHRLCELHRERANKNQWLVDQRRRLRREREAHMGRRSASPTSTCADITGAGEFFIDQQKAAMSVVAMGLGHPHQYHQLLHQQQQHHHQQQLHQPSCVLASDELAILQALLFDEDSDDDDDGFDDCLQLFVDPAPVSWAI